MELSGNDIKQLVEAIVNAYPTKEDLDMMIVYGFGVDEALAKITGGDDLTKIVFNLITKWAIPQGKIDHLIEQAYQQNKDNPKLKDFYQRLNPQPSIYKIMELSPGDSQPITKAEWNQLYFILDRINDNQLITQVCRETLRNNQNDLLGNCLELSQNIGLQSLKEILLTRFPKRNDNVPTILEFAERLSIKIDEKLADGLEQWIESIAGKLDIALPTYSESPLNNDNDIYEYFLLIAIIPKGRNQFKLEPDLLLYNSSADSYQPIPKFLNSEGGSLIEGDFTEIKDQVFALVEICLKYLKCPYTLNIQLFLTCRYLGHAFDLEKIVIDIKHYKYLGIEYPLLVSSYDRFNNKSYYNEFLIRWRTNVQNKLKPNLAQLIACLQELEKEAYNNQSLEQLVNQWKGNKIIGLKIIGCWSDLEEEQEELFDSIVRSGIPLALWIRCNNLPNCQQKLNDVLQSEPLRNWHDLFERVWNCRQIAYENPQQLGYHLGILSDDPRRIPSHLKPLIETGK